MRKSRSGTAPKTNTALDESNLNDADRTSAKKLKQARLPFKVIDPATSPVLKAFGAAAASDQDEDAVKDTHTLDGKKRKLSYGTEDDGANNDLKKDNNTSKENVEILAAAAKKKKLSATNSNDAISDVLSLLDEDEDDADEGGKNSADSSVLCSASKKELNAPKSGAKDKTKGAGTPKTGSAHKEKNSSATKLQIKLPLSSSKKKRRKSSLNQETAQNVINEKLSSDEIDDVAVKLNPRKRTKFNDANTRTETKCTTADQNKDIETIVLHSDSDAPENNQRGEIPQSTKALRSLRAKTNSKIKSTQNDEKVKHPKAKNFSKSLTEKSSANTNRKPVVEKSEVHVNIVKCDSSGDSEKEELEETVLSDNDNEADDETDNLLGKSVGISSDVGEYSKSTAQNVEPIQKNKKSTGTSDKKVFTPKQIKLMEQRRKAREEKERKLQEEKLKKQQEKEEKELARKRERDEKEEQKRKEREGKEELKRKDREERERKRLADIEVKNEEKRKKNEAKEEEMRKRDEERKRKEQEKEEAELKKKKAAQAFTKFFVAKTPSNNQIKNDEDSNTEDGTKILAFMPFQIKGDMKLAPIIRKLFTAEAKNRLDDLLDCKSNSNDGDEDDEILSQQSMPKSQLYLAELRSGKTIPGIWRRPSTESKDDVILVEDDLERVGQEIVEEIPAYVREEMRVKFYKFHDNRRPPYYGTWRKKSSFIKPRKPFAQDKKFFDYEVDSDDEWEEEEPGESLEDGSDEDKDKESEDEDYEVDNEWFVPHGHLSDEELQNEDEFGLGDDNTREAQKAKLQLLQQEFAQEMKKKTEKIKPRLIGCIWADVNGNQPPECAKILWDTLEKKAMMFDDPPLIEEPEVDRPSETNSPSVASNGNVEKVTDKLKPMGLSDSMIKDLTRLVHGNNHAKNFLINEYIAYVEKTEESIKNGDLRKPLKSVVRDKIEEIAEWQAVDANASSIQAMEQTNDESNDKKKKKVKRRLCWVVKQEMLDKMDLSYLELQNSWQYTLPPKYVKPDKEAKTKETAAPLTGESNKTSTENNAKDSIWTEKSTKSSNTFSSADPASNETSRNTTQLNASSTPKAKRRVPLLMSVARGQQISTPTKNKLISQFLQQTNKNSAEPLSSPSSKVRSDTSPTLPHIVDDDVVILD